MEKFTLPFEEPIREIEQQIALLRTEAAEKGVDHDEDLRLLAQKLQKTTEEIFSSLNAWDKVRLARHPSRPTCVEYMNHILEDFVEIHGDRRFGDDKAIVAGFAGIEGRKVVFIGQQKGRTTKEKLACNFGMPHPEGYRKALRVMRLAEKFHLPVVTFIDTMGAYPGIGSEERGVAEAIAVNLMEMSRLRTPLMSVVIGEGGSGGALGLGTGDRLMMLEYAYYSVISPEGCAAILWRSGDEAPKAAEALKLTAVDLKKLGIVDRVIPEPLGGAHTNVDEIVETLKKVIGETLDDLSGTPIDRLLDARYQKYRRLACYTEGRKSVSPTALDAQSAEKARRRQALREQAATR